MRRWRYINKVAVELEGGWDTEPIVPLQHDGSVNVSARYVGEITSGPMRPHECLTWMGKHYPTRVNRTCGLHVHISFIHVGQYAKLLVPEFHAFLKERLRTWGHVNKIRRAAFWERLNGDNSYCADEFKPEQQLHRKDKGGARYCMVNFCYSLHGTAECRVLPMFSMKRVAQAAVHEVFKIFEDWIKQAPRITAHREDYFTVEDHEILNEDRPIVLDLTGEADSHNDLRVQIETAVELDNAPAEHEIAVSQANNVLETVEV